MRRNSKLWTARATIFLLACAIAGCSGNVEGAPRLPEAGALGANGGAPGAGGAGGTGGAGGAAGLAPPEPRPMSLEGAPMYTRFMRLTNEQWLRSVQDILGLVDPPEAAASFEDPVAGTTDFANNEHVLSVTNALWASYQLASEQAAKQVVGSSTILSALYSGSDGAGFCRKLGRRAFRRPLTAEEEQRYGALFEMGATLSGEGTAFEKGAELVIRAMLQSPHFLYRTELGADGAPLTGYEVASKLSFWLLGTTPSDALLDAAGAGQLDTPAGAAAQATAMLARPEALATMREFHRELLDFDLYATLSKVGVADYSEALNAELEQSSYLFFERVFRDDFGLREILTSTVGFVGPAMAAIYGVPLPSQGIEQRDLGPARAGYFAQLPFLALHAFNEQPDPIHRGLTLNLDFLCADPGDPVANLPPVPALLPGQTNREMITSLTQGCGHQCHTYYINPLGFAFEQFDGMGRMRDTDNGKPVDTRSAYPFSEGLKEFADSAELMTIMAESKQAHACFAKKIASHALQRDIVESDLPTLEAMAAVSLAGGSLKQVMLALVQDPAFHSRPGAAP